MAKDFDSVGVELSIRAQIDQTKFDDDIRDVARKAEDLSERASDFLSNLGPGTTALSEQLTNLNQMTQSINANAAGLAHELKYRQALGLNLDSTVEKYDEISAQLKEITSNEKLMNTMTAEHHRLLAGTVDHLDGISASLQKNKGTAEEVAGIFDKMGLSGLAKITKASNKAVYAFTILFNAVREYAKFQGELSNAQMRVYGNIYETTSAVLNLSAQFGVSRQTATQTAAALARVNSQLRDTEFNKVAGDIGMVHEATGISVGSLAEFTKALEVGGASAGEISRAMGHFGYVAREFGLDASEAAMLVNNLRDSVLHLSLAFGEDAAIKHAQTLAYLAGMAKKFGVSLQSVNHMMSSSSEAAMDYSMLLGENRMFNQPAENALYLAQNIGRVSDRFGHLIKNKPEWLLNDIIGKNAADMVRGLVKAQEEYKKLHGSLEGWEEEQARLAKKRAGAQELANEQREASIKAWNAFKSSLSSAFNSLLVILWPLFKAVEYLSKAFLWLQEKTDGVAGSILAGLTVAFVGFMLVTKSLNGALGKMLGVLKKIGSSVKDIATNSPKKSVKNIGVMLKDFAVGIKSFLREMAEVKGKELWGLVVTVLIVAVLGVTLMLLARLAKELEVDNLIEMSIGLVSMAISLRLLSGVSNKIDLKGIGIFAVAAALLGVAVAAIGLAVKLAGGGEELLMGALAMVVTALVVVGALLLLGAVGNTLTAAYPGLAVFAGAAILFGVAMVAVGLAVKLAGGGEELLMGTLAMVVTALVVVGALLLLGLAGAALAAAFPGLLVFVGAAILFGVAMIAIGFAANTAVDPSMLLPLAIGALALVAAIAAIAVLAVPFMIGVGALFVGSFMLAIAFKKLGDGLDNFDPSKMNKFSSGLPQLLSVVGEVGLGFAIRSILLAYGLKKIGKALSQFAPNINLKAFGAINEFINLIVSTPKGKMRSFASEFDATLKTMAGSAEKYGSKISGSLGGALLPLKMMSSTPSIEEEPRRAEPNKPIVTKIVESLFGNGDDDPVVQELQQMNGKLDTLIDAMPVRGVTPEILGQLKEWLPEIADSDIANKRTTSWNI